MTYNLHPIFVHFPIAFLFVYSVIRVIPFERLFPRFAWRDVGRVILIVGVLGAFAALATGDTAEHLMRGANRALIETHANFAGAATALYGLILVGEICAFLNAHARQVLSKSALAEKVSLKIEAIMCGRAVSVVLSLLALAALTIAGVLGGAIVYGTTADPIAGVVLTMLGISL